MAEAANEAKIFAHPGAGGKRARAQPRGRQVDASALDAVSALLAGHDLRRDLLIEHLHRLQDRYGCLAAPHLVALAEVMKLSLAEVFEVATFYAHFDVVRDGEASPPALTIRVCDSLSCAMAGGEDLAARLASLLGAGIRVQRVSCIGRCEQAPAAEVGHRVVANATAEKVTAAARESRHTPEIAPYRPLARYRADGGYRLLSRIVSGEMAAEAVLTELEQAGLRGMGGAGFPTGRKWRAVRAEPAPRLLAVNADEGEPGTFKDRFFLETDPHRMLEGMLIAAEIIDAPDIYIYLRDEYAAIRHILEKEIAALVGAGLAGGRKLHLRRGAGAYICGEEGALLESLEGKRGLPRHKPPYPSAIGLFGRPTLINNVETLYWVPDILEKGHAWWQGQGRHGSQGWRSYSVSGRVREPGVKIAPAGINVRELIAEYCGGMAQGHRFTAYLPGGASGGILPAALDDIPLDFGKLEPHGCLIGSAAVVVLSQEDDPRAVALNLLRFFKRESCGQCTPCRVGTEKAVALMERPAWDNDLLGRLAEVMRDASICGLGQAAGNPLFSLFRHFSGAAS